MGRRSFSRSSSRSRSRGGRRGRGFRRSFSRDRNRRGRGRSYSRSSSRSSYSSRSSSPSRSRSRGRKSRSASVHSKASNERRSRSPSPDDGASLHVANLTRNVNSDHLSEIFGKFGTVANVNLEIDKSTRLPKGFAYIQFAKRAEAETAQLHMHDGQIDGNKIQVNFVLVQPKPKRSVSRSPIRKSPERRRRASPFRRRSPVGRRQASPFRRRSPIRARFNDRRERRRASPFIPRDRRSSPVRRRSRSPRYVHKPGG
ncbi:arginine/serine-rich protein 45 isoform X2 [Thraustotheca clavata]|uniref:Arginine/serine-rich protein 45 isoform X2 n=1 Tax=Thraustotheca clavata TaxID=74557 RepID=A0A1V9Z5I0_9STRA|nr:arginine/serine-rich protein 45 isoform X2 [Thraustotheca clavata]